MICWSSNWPQVFLTGCSRCCQICFSDCSSKCSSVIFLCTKMCQVYRLDKRSAWRQLQYLNMASHCDRGSYQSGIVSLISTNWKHLLILSCGPWVRKDGISCCVCGKTLTKFTFLFDWLFCNFYLLTLQIQRSAHDWLRFHLGTSKWDFILIPAC